MSERLLTYRCLGCGVEQTVPERYLEPFAKWIPVHYAVNDVDICGRMQQVNPVAGQTE